MVKQKEKTKEKEESTPAVIFDWQKTLEELAKPNMFKAGLKYYITSNNLDLKITNEKDFTKIVEEYMKLPMGE